MHTNKVNMESVVQILFAVSQEDDMITICNKTFSEMFPKEDHHQKGLTVHFAP